MLRDIKNEIRDITAGPLQYDVKHLNALLERIERLLTLLDNSVRATYLESIATTWMPNPQIADFNSPQYNSQEAFCLAIKKVLRGY